MKSPNSSASGMEIDFITAFGRLLRDGQLRDAFAADPQVVTAQINLCPRDRPAFLQLIPADLEFQARTLLRKRFELVRHLLPETVQHLGEEAWPVFLNYARSCWPGEPRPALQDALQFCRQLPQSGMISRTEWNRLCFALSKKHVAIHAHRGEPVRGKIRPLLQIFFRGRSPAWREFILRFGF